LPAPQQRTAITQIPTPSVLAGYNAIDPALPGRILARVELELDRNARYAFLGLFLSFASFVILIAAASFSVYLHEWRATACFPGTAVLGFATQLLRNRR
jgi:hypothetical protein